VPIIENLYVTHFKCFKQLDVKGLGQVNLIGGKNNVGKTAFLEAVELVLSSDKPIELLSAIINILKRRALKADDLQEFFITDFDLIYYLESSCNLKCSYETKTSKICSLEKITGILKDSSVGFPEQMGFPVDLLKMTVNTLDLEVSLEMFLKSPQIKNPLVKVTSYFISSTKVESRQIAISLGKLIDLGREDFLNNALRHFDDTFYELKQVVTENGVVLKLRLNNQNRLVLLSSLGEGINRYIAILCAIWANKDGFLLIDEIENGIHYTNYPTLWEIIFKVSVEANCQLFITTHSKECITAFNDMQFEVTNCNAQYFEFYKNLKTDRIVAKLIDKEQLQYELTHQGRVRGE